MGTLIKYFIMLVVLCFALFVVYEGGYKEGSRSQITVSEKEEKEIKENVDKAVKLLLQTKKRLAEAHNSVNKYINYLNREMDKIEEK